MTPQLVIIFTIFGAIVILACIVLFIVFIVKGVGGAHKQKKLYEKGQITQEEYDSNFNMSTNEVMYENYKHMRQLTEEEQERLDRFRKRGKYSK